MKHECETNEKLEASQGSRYYFIIYILEHLFGN